MTSVKDNVNRVLSTIERACERSGRDPAAVRIAAVAKNRSIEQIRQAVDSGITDIAENRLQEAKARYAELAAIRRDVPALQLHMVGHLQTNKVKEAVRIFDLIHSVDSLHLVQEIDSRSSQNDTVKDILLEVNTSGEPAKSGVRPDEAVGIAGRMSALPHIRLLGLMTIASRVIEPEKARPSFTLLRTLLNDINSLAPQRQPLSILSMGMSQDYEVAVEEGATMVRIGRAIFDV